MVTSSEGQFTSVTEWYTQINLLEELQTQLKAQVALYVELDEVANEYKTKAADVLTQVGRLKKALYALTGELEEQEPRAEEAVGLRQSEVPMGGLQSQPREVPPPVVSKREYSSSLRPCPACGAGMEPQLRTLKSGKTIQLLVCNDSGCNNEML